MGVKQAIAQRQGASASAFSIPTGAAMPDHDHNGRTTLVLKGAFQDADECARGG
jgi:quercetin dioxygenase-like cupin family protein